MRWQVGSGSCFHTYDDPWIANPNPSPPCVLPSAPKPLPGISFFRSGSTWIRKRLASVFTPASVSHILQIPLPTFNIPDRVIWHFSTNGLFSVKSAYHLAHQLDREANTRHTQMGPFIQGKSFWLSIRNLPVPPKIRVFLWRMFKSSLPLGPFLSKRIRAHDPTCPICLTADESPEHLFIQCEIIKRCLSFEVTPSPLRDCPDSNISLAWRFLSRLGQDVLVFVAFFWWRIWKARNEVVFSKTLQTTPSILRSFVFQSEEFRDAISSRTPPPSYRNVMSPAREWLRPLPRWIKINVDASTGSGQVGGAVGMVARTHEGLILEAKERIFPRQFSVLSLELLGFREAVLWAREKRFNFVIFEGDSLETVSHLYAKTPLHATCGAIFEDVLSICSDFPHFTFHHVPRHCNRAADFVVESWVEESLQQYQY
ncbi:Putative ribonuclease H protein At1g65750 [Linum perenne]